MNRKTPLLLSFVLTIAFFSRANAQTGDIPAFKILRSNGTSYTAADLPRDKPVIIIYFSPDCGHCQLLMDSLFKKVKRFKSAELVMVTFKPLDQVIAFEHSRNIVLYPNMIVGTEGESYFLRYHYNLTTTPFTALYNKQGKLVYTYRKETPVNDLIRRLDKLNHSTKAP